MFLPYILVIPVCSVREESADSIRRMLPEDHCCLETFDIKFTAIQSDDNTYGENLSVRVRFEHGEPKILLARKSDVKTVVCDVICLHR